MINDILTNNVILITGGAGFIGSHLCEKLLSLGNRVICLDNFNDFYAPSLKWENLNSIINNPFFTLFEGDIRDEECLNNLFKFHSPNLVIHLAAMAGVRPSLENPSLYYDVNINGTYKLLEICKSNYVKHFVFASSSSVYGNNKKLPFSESDPVDNPISPYAYSKKSGELLSYLYYHLYGMSIVCLRFFTVYGPRQRPDLAIRKFTESIINKILITLFGDGTAQRDYTYIDDIIDGVLKSINYVKLQRCYEIFNLGESSPITLTAMISEIEDQLQIKAECVYLPMQPGDVDMTYADINKSKRLLGYNPSTDFKKGLRKFIDWYLTNR
jgi:UDP-glucuronate 4-epimerase